MSLYLMSLYLTIEVLIGRGGPCGMSILRNANFKCHLCFLMSHVEFTKSPCICHMLKSF